MPEENIDLPCIHIMLEETSSSNLNLAWEGYQTLPEGGGTQGQTLSLGR